MEVIMGKAVVSSVLLSESASKLLKRSVIFVVHLEKIYNENTPKLNILLLVLWNRSGVVLILFSFNFLFSFKYCTRSYDKITPHNLSKHIYLFIAIYIKSNNALAPVWICMEGKHEKKKKNPDYYDVLTW